MFYNCVQIICLIVEGILESFESLGCGCHCYLLLVTLAYLVAVDELVSVIFHALGFFLVNGCQSVCCHGVRHVCCPCCCVLVNVHVNHRVLLVND